MKKITLIFAIVSHVAYSQLIPLFINDHFFIKPTKDNLVRMLQMTNKEWQQEMKNQGYVYSKLTESCDCYKKGDVQTIGEQEICKSFETNSMISISWLDVKNKTFTMRDLIEELSPYFYDKDKDLGSIFAYKISPNLTHYYSVRILEAGIEYCHLEVAPFY